ncbi:hypothetical protein B879_02270 [Cecembia lonarensis LW9]|uniref:DUF2784 domain-containing protein n=2 Tax=Cecembia TaxID=1187078 RepID=K1LFI9_CECL9|nr:hypothetical protein B879_02270 [Cecembia lonarensis LW9]
MKTKHFEMDNKLFLDIGDYFFTVFHSLLILFNLFAWIWKPLRKWHLWTISLTFSSWIILGIWYGWGYCPLTDWHWEILRQKGVYNLPNSYISYLLARILKLELPAKTVDLLTLVLALAALIISIWVNFLKKPKYKGK